MIPERQDFLTLTGSHSGNYVYYQDYIDLYMATEKLEAKYKALAKISDMQEKEIRGLKIEAMDYKDTNMHLGEECDMQIEKIQELKEVLTKVFYQTNYCPDEDYLKIEKLINKDNNIRKTLNKH